MIQGTVAETGEVFVVYDGVDVEPYATYYREIVEGLYGEIAPISSQGSSVPIPSISNFAFRVALNSVGALATVQQELESAGGEFLEQWGTIERIVRESSLVTEVKRIAQLTDSEVDDLFRLVVRSYGDAALPTGTRQPSTTPLGTVSMKQARLALHQAGYLSGVEAVINSLESPLKETVKISWEYASEVVRTDPLIAVLAAALELTTNEVDTLFISAMSL